MEGRQHVLDLGKACGGDGCDEGAWARPIYRRQKLVHASEIFSCHASVTQVPRNFLCMSSTLR